MTRQKRYSGKFVLRVGPELHRQLASDAEQRGLSLNEHCRRRLANEQSSGRYASIGLDAAFIESVVRAFPAEPLGVVLFGSFARRDQTELSDIDLFVVFETGTPIERSLYRYFDDGVDLTGFAHTVNPHLVALPRSVAECGSIWFEVAQEGFVMWETAGLVSSFLRDVRRAIADGEIQRRVAHGHPYWVREGALR